MEKGGVYAPHTPILLCDLDRRGDVSGRCSNQNQMRDRGGIAPCIFQGEVPVVRVAHDHDPIDACIGANGVDALRIEVEADSCGIELGAERYEMWQVSAEEPA